MATDDQTAGVQRFWVWAPGMLATTQDGRRKVRITEHTLGVGHEMVPDLSDAATVAAIVRTAQAEVERLRAELAQARAEGEAAGYRRAIDEACATLGARCNSLAGWVLEDDSYNAGRLRGLDLAEDIVRTLAPVKPVSNADKLPGGAT